MSTADEIELPVLPKADFNIGKFLGDSTDGFSTQTLQAYARASIQADRERGEVAGWQAVIESAPIEGCSNEPVMQTKLLSSKKDAEAVLAQWAIQFDGMFVGCTRQVRALFTRPMPATVTPETQAVILEATQIIRDHAKDLCENGWSRTGEDLALKAILIEREVLKDNK